MSEANCECPHCRRQLSVRWSWKALKTAYLHDDDGEVVTGSDCLDAMRVAYQRHMVCPHCGTRLRIEHELMPMFYASREGCDGRDQ